MLSVPEDNSQRLYAESSGGRKLKPDTQDIFSSTGGGGDAGTSLGHISPVGKARKDQLAPHPQCKGHDEASPTTKHLETL